MAFDSKASRDGMAPQRSEGVVDRWVVTPLRSHIDGVSSSEGISDGRVPTHIPVKSQAPPFGGLYVQPDSHKLYSTRTFVGELRAKTRQGLEDVGHLRGLREEAHGIGRRNGGSKPVGGRAGTLGRHEHRGARGIARRTAASTP